MTDTKPVHKRTTGGGSGLGAKAPRRGPRAAMEQFLLAIGGGFRPTAIEAHRLKRPGGRT